MFEEPLSFPCPNCREIINDRMKECRFCHTPIDPGIARQIGETQRLANRAFSDSGYTRNAAFLMWGLLAASMVPFVPWVFSAFTITLIAVIGLTVYWYLKYGNLNTGDADYQRAKGAVLLALVLWLVALPVAFVIRPWIARALFGVAG